MTNPEKHTPFILPIKAIGYGGDIFFPNEDVWKFSSSSRYVSIRFDNIRQWATNDLINSLKLALCVEAQRVKARTLQSVMEMGVRRLLKFAYSINNKQLDNITLELVQAFSISLDIRHQPILNFVKMLSRALIIYGNPDHGITPIAAKWLDKQKPSQNPRGEAVMTWDPIKGPLLPSEDRLLMSALHATFERAEIQLQDYIKILLFRLSGMRPAQIADLKCKDLTVRDGIYYLNFPQAKKRGEQWRESFEEWALVPEFGALLVAHIAQEKAKWAHLNIPDEEFPLFVNHLSKDKGRPYHYVGGSIASCIPTMLSRFKAFDPISRKLVIINSPRTNQPFKINMRRFRSSIATWALAKGASLIEVAKLLGHTGLAHSINAYAAIDIDILEEMDRKMSSSEVRTAGYFLGELSSHPDKTPGFRLYPESFGGIAVGKCTDLCNQRKPVACYTCQQFVAFMNGAHEQVLSDLEEEREQIIASGGTAQISTHDHAIQSVKLVIALRDKRLSRDGFHNESYGPPD